MAYRSIDITQINAGNVNNGKTVIVQGNTFVFSDSAPSNTSNVTEGTNLYFTNARVYANVIGLLNGKANIADLTTSNVIEGANLYFTNNRAISAFTAGQNVSIAANGLISVTNQQFSGNTDTVPEGTANLYFTNARARAAFASGDNVSIDANGVIRVTVYASNVIENGNTTSGNVFFTNSRARAAFTAGNGINIEANGMIISTSSFSGNTDSVSEGTSLYFTNARAVAAIESANTLLLGNLIPKSSGQTLGNATHRWKNLFLEGNTLSIGNLYLKDIGNRLIITTDPDGITTNAPLDTGNVSETSSNLYYTNARVYANVIPLLNEKANITDLTTSNVIEGTNLYFTNARAILATIPAVTQLNISTPVFNYNIDQYSGDNPTIYVSAGETISFQLNQSASHPLAIRVSNGGANYDTGLTHVGLDGTISTGSSAQGKTSGKLFWKIPYELAGNTYVYQCTVHSSMVGSIIIQKQQYTLTTTDISEGANLYFTNARSRSAFVAGNNISIDANGLITAANQQFTGNTNAIPEGSANLYYSNSRVKGYLAAGDNFRITGNLVIEGNLYVTGNTSQFNVQTLVVSDNLIHLNANSNTSNPDIGFAGNYFDAGLYAHAGLFRDASDGGIWKFFEGYQPEPQGQFIDTSNATYKLSNVAANYIFGNIIGRIDSLAGLTTDNLIEGTGNLYFTNARSRSAFVAGNNITIAANGMIVGAAQSFSGNTDIVPEGVSNLYYTNARVYANVLNISTFANKTLTNVHHSSNIQDSLGTNTYVIGYRNVPQNPKNAAYTLVNSDEGKHIYYTGSSATILVPVDGGTSGGNFANGAAIAIVNGTGNNLYVNSLATIRIFGTPITGNLTLPGNGFVSLLKVSANTWYASGTAVLDTDSITEGSNNLYFTNARARSAFVAGTGITIAANGLITGTAAFTGNTDAVLESASNLYYTNARVYANVLNITTLANKTFTNVHHSSNIQDSLGTNTYVIGYRGVPQNPKNSAYTLVNADEGKHIYYTGSGATLTIPVDGGTSGGDFANGAVIAIVNNGTGSVYVNSLATIKTFGSSFVGNITLPANGIVSVMKVSANTWYASGTSTTDSDSVTEGAINLYYTNARARTAFVAGNNIVIEANGMIVGTTQAFSGNTNIVSEGSLNLYYTNARVYANVIGLINAKANVTDLTTSNVTEGTNLYFTNARVYANVISLINAKANVTDLTTSNVTEGTNLYFTNARVASYINQFVYASNIRENGDTTSGNVYFTNARARAAFTAGNGITIAANGMIVSTATGSSGSSVSSVLVLNESQTFTSAANGNVASYLMTTSPSSAANILVSLDGLIQIPTTDYTVSGTTITFNEALPASTNVEIKYFGVSGSAIDARGYFSKNIDQSVGYAVSNTLSTAVTFPSGTNEYIVHSVHVTNIDANLSTNVAITARFDFSATGANVIFAYQMPVDARGSLELLKKPQIMNSNDRIMLQAFDNGVAANSNVLHAIIVYETRTTPDYVGTGANISTITSNVYVSNNSPTIIESIRLVNTSTLGNTAVTVSWTDANGVIQAYLCFGMIIPTNASVELCETPKRIASNHMIRAFASGNNSIGLFVSGRTQL